MEIPVSEAKGRLTDLVRRAETGAEVVLTRHGRPVVKLIPVSAGLSADERRMRRKAALEALRGCAKGKPGFEGVDAVHATDFLYDDRGLPA